MKRRRSEATTGRAALRDDPDIKNFVIKVYAIVTAQLILTTIGTIAVYNSEDAKQFIRDNAWLWWVCLILGMVISCKI